MLQQPQRAKVSDYTTGLEGAVLNLTDGWQQQLKALPEVRNELHTLGHREKGWKQLYWVKMALRGEKYNKSIAEVASSVLPAPQGKVWPRTFSCKFVHQSLDWIRSAAT